MTNNQNEQIIQLQNQLLTQITINDCAKAFIQTVDFKESVKNVLKIVLNYYNAKSVFVYNIDKKTNEVSNFSQDNADNKSKNIDYLNAVNSVVNTFNDSDNTKIISIDLLKDGIEKDTLKSLNINTILALGFVCTKGFVVHICVINPQVNNENTELINELSSLLSFQICKFYEYDSLNQSEEKYHITMEQINKVMFDNVLEADITEDKILGKNCDALADQLNIPRGSTYTQTIKAISQQLTHPDFAEEYCRVLSRENIINLLNQGTKYLKYECIEKSDGVNYRWIRVHYCIYKSEITNTVHIISYVKNIDEEKQTAINLITKAQNTLMDYEYLSEIDVENDTYTRYDAANGFNFEFPKSGHYSDEVISNCNYIVEHEQQEFKDKLSINNIIKELENNKVASYTFNVNVNSQYKLKKFNYFYLDDNKEKVCCTMNDVTEIVKAEQTKNEMLETALLAAKQASSAKSDFLSKMSHEIRTPMNAIIGMATIAAQSIGDDEQTADCISKIGISSRFLLSLINDILDMSRIESGKMLLKSEKIPFEEFINGINSICVSQANAKDVDYENIVDHGVDDYYIGDAMKLQQVIINILSNAIKFTSSGGKVSLSVKEVKKTKNAATLRFVINDTGCGISQSFIPNLFDPFEQEHSGTTTMYGGTGLGLAICKNLVDMMDGQINVRSIVGVGSEFTVDVKLGVTEESKTRYITNPNYHFEKLTALVVDDEVTVCEQTVITLSEIGMASEWVDSGRKAVDTVKEKWANDEHYDFILVDWKMPDMDGIQTTREIRKIVGQEVTIIIMTAYDWTSIEHEAKMAGVNLLMSKPMFKSSLISTFEKALGKTIEKETIIDDKYKFDGKRILLAEDHPLNVEVAKKLLERKGFEVEVADNGLRALEMFTSTPVGYYYAILMDIRMPEMDGLQASYNIRRWRKEDAKTIPIIAMTANAFDEDVQKSKAAGMNVHLAKPIDPQLLYQTLYDFLDNNK